MSQLYNGFMQNNRQYKLIAEAIQWMADHQAEQPDLERLSAMLAVSPHHLQRTFQAWAGVSPKQFLKSLTREAALDRLVSGNSVLDAALSSGLSGPGRLHDLMISTEALTPGEIRKRGLGVDLEYGIGGTPFGRALVSWTSRGVNFLGFCEETGSDRAFHELQGHWSQANFHENPDEAKRLLARIFDDSREKPIAVWLRGSPFQLKVWEALLAIPDGSHATYGLIAKQIGNPSACRAVGSAVGANPVSWIIPCHRVIRQLGELGAYRWGETTKRAMIGLEASRFSPTAVQ